MRVVDSLEDAMAHIAQYGTGHTETIITQDTTVSREFAATVNAASIAINGATEPPELFITQRPHARGPLRPEAFTATKYLTWPS